jgi:SAM-dependent methyltransferase
MTLAATDPDTAFRAAFARFGGMLRASPRYFELNWDDRRPCRDDQTPSTSFDRHYVYHTAWAARLLERLRPSRHVDIASSLYFAAIASAFVPVKYYEYRPVDLALPNLSCDTADLTRLPFADASVRSLSCMHVVEHVGLGRYGDALDPDGDVRAMDELSRVLAPGGHLLFVVPVGKPVVQFNAHRIYGFDQVRESFASLDLVEFSLVPDRTDADGSAIIVNATKAQSDRQRYGCGCFWFRKPGATRPDFRRPA